MIEFVSISGTKYCVKKSTFVGYRIQDDDDDILLYFTFEHFYVRKEEFERIKGELL